MTRVVRRALVQLGHAAVAALVVALYQLVRALPPRLAVSLGGRLARGVGTIVPRSVLALRHIRESFPEKTADEHRAILGACWDNLGRTAVEYCHLDRLWRYDPHNPAGSTIEIDGSEHFEALQASGRPAIIVAAHLANWELPMVAAAVHGLNVAALYRPPNNRFIARWVLRRRKAAMGSLIESRPGALHALSTVLAQGTSLGLLVDQHFWGGVPVEFFGRRALANPSFARLARMHDVPVHAVRVIRLPGARFRVELTGPLDLPRDPNGRVDIHGAVAHVHAVFERWIGEHPGQWLWLHRRWR